jgi:quercetin dioxygenase-like cupin family protein
MDMRAVLAAIDQEVWEMIVKKETHERLDQVWASSKYRYLVDRRTSEATEVQFTVWPPGAESPSHCHDDMEQFYFILSGRAIVTVGEDRDEVGAGDLVFIPRHVMHSLQCDPGLEFVLLGFGVFPSAPPERSEPSAS